MANIHDELQSLSPSAFVELFELNLAKVGGGIERFCSTLNPKGEDVVWQGNRYSRMPIAASGFDKSSAGALPRPTLRVSNVGGGMGAFARENRYFEGCKLTRKRTFARFLDAVNFPTAAEATRNLLPSTAINTGFGDWLTVQQATGQTPIITEAAHETSPIAGEVVYQIDLSRGAAPMAKSLVASKEVPATVGARYTGSMYIKGPAGVQMQLNPCYETSQLSTGSPLQTLTGEWQRLEVTVVAKSALVSYEFGFRLTTANGGNVFPTGPTRIFVSGVQLEAGLTAAAFQPTPRQVFIPTPDPTQHLPDEVWFVDRKSTENSSVIEFELASVLDMQGVMLPRRQIIQNCCAWIYRSPECSYTGGPVAKADGTPTSDPAQDSCGLRLSDCKKRFTSGVIPYGGFPGCGLVK